MYDYKAHRADKIKVKEWAKATGFPVPGNATVTKAMVDAYNAATQGTVEYFPNNVPREARSAIRAKRLNDGQPIQTSKPDLLRGRARPKSNTKRDRYLYPGKFREDS